MRGVRGWGADSGTKFIHQSTLFKIVTKQVKRQTRIREGINFQVQGIVLSLLQPSPNNPKPKWSVPCIFSLFYAHATDEWMKLKEREKAGEHFKLKGEYGSISAP